MKLHSSDYASHYQLVGVVHAKFHVLMQPENAALAAALKPWALSQYMRCPADTSNASMFWKGNACLMTDRTLFLFMGYSVRTAEWRYTEWTVWNGTSLRPEWGAAGLIGRELYSHVGDDGTDFDAFENRNIYIILYHRPPASGCFKTDLSCVQVYSLD